MKPRYFKTAGYFLSVTLFASVLFPAFLSAAVTSPTEAIRTRVDAVITILKDPAYDGSAQKAEEQHEALFNAAKDLFDFRTISMLATGQNWKRFSGGEKTRFTDLFTRLLANTYIEKLQDNFKNETVVYDGEDMVADDRSEVRTHINLRDGKAVPIVYRLRLINNEWCVYDANIENISLVQNYRTQFDDFLMKNEPKVLVDHMADRVQQLEKERLERRKTGEKSPAVSPNDTMDLKL